MRNSGLRTSWIATILAGVLAMGTPLVADVGQNTSEYVPAGGRAFTDRGSQVGAGTELRAAEGAKPAEHRDEARERERPTGALLVRVPRSLQVRARPEAGSAMVGTMPSGSKYYDVPITAWVEETANHGRWGRVEIPYGWPRREGWIPLIAMALRITNVEVHVDLSKHWLSVSKFGHTLFGLRAATGAAVSPTPPGEYFVTDRIPFPAGGSLGSFAFGISGIQPQLPPGWDGGNQLAIHGTNDPSSIGTSASAGCLRVSEQGLDRLHFLMRLGTPVIIEP